MILECPVCTTSYNCLILHPHLLKCWWCGHEVDYQALTLVSPFDFDCNYRPCSACGLMLSIGNSEHGYCIECIKPDYENDD